MDSVVAGRATSGTTDSMDSVVSDHIDSITDHMDSVAQGWALFFRIPRPRPETRDLKIPRPETEIRVFLVPETETQD